MRLSALWEGLLSALYPRRAVCMGCGSAAGFTRWDWLCDDCHEAIVKLWVGARPLPEVPEASGAAFCYWYAGPARGLVRRLKYGGVKRLAEPMAASMARAYSAIEPTGAQLVTFVPMHPRRERRRGYNHAELLARGVAKGLGLPCEDALVRTKNVRQQARLGREERLRNLEGVIACRGDAAGRIVLLVDDICTTGATLRACAQALLQGGAKAVYVLCFCRAAEAGEKR